MATFLKIDGNTYINADLITDVLIDRPGLVILAFASPEPESVGASDWSVGSRTIRVSGPDAERLLTWLDSISTDLTIMDRSKP